MDPRALFEGTTFDTQLQTDVILRLVNDVVETTIHACMNGVRRGFVCATTPRHAALTMDGGRALELN